MFQGLFNYDNPVWRFIGKLGDLVLLNLLWVICCIPVFTAGGDLDIIIADAKTLEHYESQGAFLDLKEFLPQDLLERAEKEDLFFYTDNEKGQSTAAAISLEPTAFSDMTGVSIQPPYLAVIASSQHTEDTLRAIQWLFDQK